MFLNIYFTVLLLISAVCFYGGSWGFGIIWALTAFHAKFVTDWKAW
jgi:hypothetical protein